MIRTTIHLLMWAVVAAAVIIVLGVATRPTNYGPCERTCPWLDKG